MLDYAKCPSNNWHYYVPLKILHFDDDDDDDNDDDEC